MRLKSNRRKRTSRMNPKFALAVEQKRCDGAGVADGWADKIEGVVEQEAIHLVRSVVAHVERVRGYCDSHRLRQVAVLNTERMAERVNYRVPLAVKDEDFRGRGIHHEYPHVSVRLKDRDIAGLLKQAGRFDVGAESGRHLSGHIELLDPLV